MMTHGDLAAPGKISETVGSRLASRRSEIGARRFQALCDPAILLRQGLDRSLDSRGRPDYHRF